VGQARANTPQIFLYLILVFFGCWVERGQVKKIGAGVVCMFMKNWFEPIFPLFITLLLRKFANNCCESPPPGSLAKLHADGGNFKFSPAKKFVDRLGCNLQLQQKKNSVGGIATGP
jgi:hypothetical protein